MPSDNMQNKNQDQSKVRPDAAAVKPTDKGLNRDSANKAGIQQDQKTPR